MLTLNDEIFEELEIVIRTCAKKYELKDSDIFLHLGPVFVKFMEESGIMQGWAPVTFKSMEKKFNHLRKLRDAP